jgi:endoglucanase
MAVDKQVALDYVAPMLSLAAYNVLTNPLDPYFTSLQAGEYDKHKPTGQPCDAAFNCQPGAGSSTSSLSRAGKIAMGVIVGVAGLAIVMLTLHWGWLCFKSK